MASYRIAAPDEYLAITGMGIKSGKFQYAGYTINMETDMSAQSKSPRQHGFGPSRDACASACNHTTMA